jgi:PAS domain S-box-containing protein
MRTIHPVDLPKFLKQVEYAQKAGSPIEGEFRYRRHDGALPLVLGPIHAGQGHGGNLIRRVGVAVDITDRIERYARCAKSENRYRGIFDQTAVGLCETLVGGPFTAVNQRFCDMLGYTRQEMMALTPLAVTHPDDPRRSRPAHRRAGQRQLRRVHGREALRPQGRRRRVGADVGLVRARRAVPRHPPGRGDPGRSRRTNASRPSANAASSSPSTSSSTSPDRHPGGRHLGRFLHVNDAWLRDARVHDRGRARAGGMNWKR